VRNWIGDVFTAGVRHAEPALTEVPGGGRLLVQSPRGPWVVSPDGSRRLLGRYDEATWSPHGLFIAAASGRTLSAIEPDGTPHWSVSAKTRVSDPRWSPSGFRIAYRAGRTLRVVRADGTGDAAIGPSAAVPPAWFPPGPHLLAYVDAKQRLVVTEADGGRMIDSAAARPGAIGLSWSRNGGELLEVTRRGAWVREVQIDKLAAGLRLGPAQRLPLPANAVVRAAAYSPRGNEVAVLLGRSSKSDTPRSEAILISPSGGPSRRLFTVSGRLDQLAWSPDGSRVLLAWPAADQWLFVPVRRGAPLRAVGNIASVFSPGAQGRARFPRIEGWCC
jgi:hypothetical protein